MTQSSITGLAFMKIPNRRLNEVKEKKIKTFAQYSIFEEKTFQVETFRISKTLNKIYKIYFRNLSSFMFLALFPLSL